MRWEKLLFAHWPIDPQALRSKLPQGLELDLWDGKAWIGVVPFTMIDVSPRGLPHVPFFGDFAEINVRTYVKAKGRPGVWFYSLDAASRVAVAIAQRTFHLPYYNASIQLQDEQGSVNYRSSRLTGGADFVARYKAEGDVYRAAQGSFDAWLTERYCLYAEKPEGTLLRGEIHHAPWPLQQARAKIETNTLCQVQGIELPPIAPVLHYAERLDVVAWWPDQV